jgi:hypothetical protein
MATCVPQKTTQQLPKLTRSQIRKYKRMRAVCRQISRLNARLEILGEEKDELSEFLESVFGDDNLRRISARLLLRRKEVKVPEALIKRKGYRYAKWTEIET